MIRRNFLGSVLGTFIGTTIPFKVEEPNVGLEYNHPYNTKVDLSILTRYERYVRAYFQCLKDKNIILKTYKTNIILADGKIKGPPIKSVELQQQTNSLSLLFKYKQIKVTQPIKVIGCELINDKNYVVQQSTFNWNCNLLPCDTLNIDQTLNLCG